MRALNESICSNVSDNSSVRQPFKAPTKRRYGYRKRDRSPEQFMNAVKMSKLNLKKIIETHDEQKSPTLTESPMLSAPKIQFVDLEPIEEEKKEEPSNSLPSE